MTSIDLPTEPIGSIPRPHQLLSAVREHEAGRLSNEGLERAYDKATEETIQLFEATGSPIITDGEQRKPSFATYPVAGGENISSNGLVVVFSDEHTRILPSLTSGPFRYQRHAYEYLKSARRFTNRPIKQAVISASLLSTLYPSESISGYSKDRFLEDLIGEVHTDIKGSLDAGAEIVQVDFTEAPLAVKLDPSGNLLKDFVGLNNQVFAKLSPDERKKVGVHICKGGDWNTTHSGEVDYYKVVPQVFDLNVPRLYFATAGESDPDKALRLFGKYAKTKE